jgi:hypothetical protein
MSLNTLPGVLVYILSLFFRNNPCNKNVCVCVCVYVCVCVCVLTYIYVCIYILYGVLGEEGGWC